jgi:NAD-dependent deacetylase
MEEKNLDALAAKVADLIVAARKVIVFTGAGVSTESGIPDFRGPDGLWSKFDPKDFTIEKFLRSAETRRKQWQLLSGELTTGEAKPNAAHYAIAELHQIGKLDCVITQNVDNLHQAAGISGDKVYELHGNMRRVVCLKCHRVYSFDKIKARLARGNDSFDCEVCRGILKPDVVFFGEALPHRVVAEATVHASNCDLFLVIGSSLVVYPAAYMPQYALDAGAKLVIINLSPTDMDDRAAVVIRAKAGEAMKKSVERVKATFHHTGFHRYPVG